MILAGRTAPDGYSCGTPGREALPHEAVATVVEQLRTQGNTARLVGV